MVSSRTVLLFVILGSLSFVMGCANIWHELQPHRIQRMNRGPAPSLDPEFTLWKRKEQTRLANQDTTPKDATMSANSAEIATVRAQSPDVETP